MIADAAQRDLVLELVVPQDLSADGVSSGIHHLRLLSSLRVLFHFDHARREAARELVAKIRRDGL